jgi:hypothetical protein
VPGSAGREPIVGYPDVVPLLLAACPSFRGSSESTRADPADGEYLFVAHLAAHVVRQLERGSTGCFQAVGDMVEWILTDGDADARMLVVEGLLQPLLDQASYRGTRHTPVDLYGWLGPRARTFIPTGTTGPPT